MSESKAINVIRLFIYGLSNESDATTIEQRARSFTNVVRCQVSTNGLCRIDYIITTLEMITEDMFIDYLTFDKYVNLMKSFFLLSTSKIL